MSTPNRADWLEDQSRLHFNKLGSLAAKTVNAQTMGQMVAHADLEKEAGIGKAISSFFRRGPKSTAQAARGARAGAPGPRAMPVRAQGGTPGARAMPATQPPTRGAPPTQYSGGVDPYAKTMAPSASTARAMPTAAPGQVAPVNRATTVAQRVPAPPPGLNLPTQNPVLARQRSLPAPQFPATKAELAQEMQKMRAAGVDPAQAERLRSVFGHKGAGMRTSTPVGHAGQLRTSFQGMAPAGGIGRGQNIPLYMPKMSQHKLSALILDIIDRSKEGNALTKTASERATLDEEGILKTASEGNYWMSPRGAIHLTFLSGVYDEDPDLAWDMAKNAGLDKEAIGLGGVAKFLGTAAGKAAGGASRAAGGIQKGYQATTGAIGRGAGAVAGAARRGYGAAQRGYGATTGAAQRGAGNVSNWWKGQGKFTNPSGVQGFNPFQRAGQRVQQAGSQAAGWAKAAPGRAMETVRGAGRRFASNVREGYVKGRMGPGADVQFRKPGGGTMLNRGRRPGQGWNRSTVHSDTTVVGGNKGTSGGGPYRSKPKDAPDPDVPPRVNPDEVKPNAGTTSKITGPEEPARVNPGEVVPNKTQAAGTAADAAGITGGGDKAGTVEPAPGFWDRSAGKTLRHMGLATAIGVPLVGYGGLQAAQSFIGKQPGIHAPYQYGMAAPQDWNRSWQM